MSQKEKIFYIGMQRCGTTTVGRFFSEQGYKVAGWEVSARNSWSVKSLDGNYKDIVNSKDFMEHKVFEDGPWFNLEIIKYLWHESDQYKFILLERPADDWFKSMITHTDGLTIGDVQRHCELYDRLEDYHWLSQNLQYPDGLLLSLYDNPTHYIRQYEKKMMYMKHFFSRMPNSQNRVYSGKLYNDKKFDEICDFLDITSPNINRNLHSHKSKVGASTKLQLIRDSQLYLKDLNKK